MFCWSVSTLMLSPKLLRYPCRVPPFTVTCGERRAADAEPANATNAIDPMIIVARRFMCSLLKDVRTRCSRNVEVQVVCGHDPRPPGGTPSLEPEHARWRGGRDRQDPAAKLMCGRTLERYGNAPSNGTGKSTRAVPSTRALDARATA